MSFFFSFSRDGPDLVKGDIWHNSGHHLRLTNKGDPGSLVIIIVTSGTGVEEVSLAGRASRRQRRARGPLRDQEGGHWGADELLQCRDPAAGIAHAAAQRWSC